MFGQKLWSEEMSNLVFGKKLKYLINSSKKNAVSILFEIISSQCVELKNPIIFSRLNKKGVIMSANHIKKNKTWN